MSADLMLARIGPCMDETTIEDWAAEVAAQFPPLTPETADRLARLLMPEVRGDEDSGAGAAVAAA